jgi:hypothetical protein
LNYFNYFTEIEDTFVRRRARHLLLSSIDWALIESWKEMGIPLHIVLRGIEKAFDSWESKPRKRSVKTLLYCQEEVEAQYAEWLESRVGAAATEAEVAADTAEESAAPFSRSVILEHLQRARTQFLEVAERNAKANGKDDSQIGSATVDAISEALLRAAALTDDLEREFAAAPKPDPQQLEISLTGIDRMLSEALLVGAPPSQFDELTTEIKSQLRPYRSQMEPQMYEQTLDNLRLKRLREQFGVPRLSLFFL